MLRTNCKQALDNIRAFILENTDTTNYDEIPQPQTFKEAAEVIMSRFFDEYMKGYALRMNHQTAFEDWLSGLPSVFNSASYYYYGSAVDILGALLEETEEEKSRFDEMAACKTLSSLIYRECTKATGKY